MTQPLLVRMRPAVQGEPSTSGGARSKPAPKRAAASSAVADLFREYVFRIGREIGIDVGYQDFEGEMATFPARSPISRIGNHDR